MISVTLRYFVLLCVTLRYFALLCVTLRYFVMFLISSEAVACLVLVVDMKAIYMRLSLPLLAMSNAFQTISSSLIQ
ncbi:MAG: hypothetical protein A6F72_06295 [Cycloclasticus sp. symbiont of Poecilosclerida sp. N]|nr:MAG: hypothetical protein A6F72_06295 [Cycloclasticus sp. symbiont of Poecilosclerida sp. N]